MEVILPFLSKLNKLGKEDPSILKKKYKEISSFAAKCIDFNNITISGIYKTFFELLFFLKVSNSNHIGKNHIVNYIGFKDNIPRYKKNGNYEKIEYDHFKYYNKLEILLNENLFPKKISMKIKPSKN